MFVFRGVRGPPLRIDRHGDDWLLHLTKEQPQQQDGPESDRD